LNSITGKPVYWPYWPEYYAWEEENMRMALRIKGAVMLATALGYSKDSKAWNDSLTIASAGIYNESMYNKYEAYDYFGVVLWGLDTNITSEDQVMRTIPAGIVTSYGVKDLPTNDYAGTADTIDYMSALVRVGNYSGASYYLHILNNTIQDQFNGGFYPSINSLGFAQYGAEDSYSASRFVFFEMVALGVNDNFLI
jgi:hypothetical protein